MNSLITVLPDTPSRTLRRQGRSHRYWRDAPFYESQDPPSGALALTPPVSRPVCLARDLGGSASRFVSPPCSASATGADVPLHALALRARCGPQLHGGEVVGGAVMCGDRHPVGSWRIGELYRHASVFAELPEQMPDASLDNYLCLCAVRCWILDMAAGKQGQTEQTQETTQAI